MIAVFKNHTELTLVTNLDSDEDPTEEEVAFQPGDKLDFCLVDHPQRVVNGKLVDDVNLWNIQLSDGSMVFGVDPAWFEPAKWK